MHQSFDSMNLFALEQTLLDNIEKTHWLRAAAKAGIDTADVTEVHSLDERVEWAKDLSLEIGAVYFRSSARSPMTGVETLVECLEAAAARRIFIPHEYVVLENSRVTSNWFASLTRNLRHAGTLVTPTLSRVARSGLQGYSHPRALKGCRLIAVENGIDSTAIMP